MKFLKIGDKDFQVPDEVYGLALGYYNLWQEEVKKHNALKKATAKVRRLQTDYYKARTPDLLRASKAAERELDDLLAGKETAQEAQAELFR